ncbi:MAG: metal ABC transporter ATP-binding protein [Candidatus Latescibacterota bacterium]
MGSEETMVSLEHVSAGYAEGVALQNVSISVRRGEFLGIIGPNGAGKTTLFKLVLGLMRPASGSVEVLGYAGRDVQKARPRLGYLPQREEIDSRSLGSVLDVVLMGRYSRIGLFRRVRAHDREIALAALAQVRMSAFASYPIGHLSAGQQQRVLVARTLAQEPDILLLDEPTTALDVATQQELIHIIGEIHRTLGLTILFITHDINILIGLADRVLYINRRLYAIGPPKEILTEEMLTEMYGHEVTILTRPDGRPCVIVGDSHA